MKTLNIRTSPAILGAAIGACSIIPAVAFADTGQTQAATATPSEPAAAPNPAPTPPSAGLTYAGLTLYGTIDLGVAYLSHGAPLSDTYGPGLPFMLQKFSSRSIVSIAPNGLSQSKIGVSGKEPLAGDVSFVFKLETGFQPTSFQLTDGPKSLVKNNGRALNQQIEAGDSSRAGQLFQGYAYLGLQSKLYGTLTYGRQNSLLLDNIAKYDPQQQSQAFSAIGYSGVAGGGGDTEDARLDDSLKYVFTHGPAHVALMHQFSGSTLPGGADAVDVGAEFNGLSIDASYSHVSDAVSAASLTAAQAVVAPGTLAATVSDNTTWSANAKYVAGPATFYFGYENIEYSNPAHPLSPGVKTVGGYQLSFINNANFTHHKLLRITWLGVKYRLNKTMYVTGAYYRYDQSSFAAVSCSDASASSCSGQMNSASVVVTKKLIKNLDVYSGLNYSADANGLASGFLNRSVTSPMVGARFNF